MHKWAKRNVGKFFALIAVFAFVSLSTTLTTSLVTYAAPGDPAPTTVDPAKTGSDSDGTTTCAVEKIGWFICPVLEQAAKISDKSFDVLANNFLRTDPGLVSSNSGTRDAWEYARNIANVMFIIAFLIIILSQVTGQGLNNYNIKKMLPRLVIAAIAVNVSYYICQAIVDITNILGYEIQNTLTGIANGIGPSVFGNAAQYGVVNKSNGAWGNIMEYIVVAALAAAGIVWLVMGPMLAVIMMVLITAITIIVILLLRKALIVLLIVISPIAIVLYLLPNTEKYFSKWMRMFGQILMVFPVIGLLFGAGQLASTIVLVAGAQSTTQAESTNACNPDVKDEKDAFKKSSSSSSYDVCGAPSITISGTKDGQDGACVGGRGAGCQKTASIMLALVATGIAIAPLIAVWSVLKGALSAAGSVGGRLSAGITKGAGGFAKSAEARDQARQNRLALRAMNGGSGIGARTYRRRARRNAIQGSVDSELKRAQQSYITGELSGAGGTTADTSLQKKMAGGTALRSATPEAMQRIKSAAEAAVTSASREEMNALQAQANQEGWTQDDWSTLAAGGMARGRQGGIAQKAAIMKAANESDVNTLHRAIISAIKEGNRATQRDLAEAINSNFGNVKAKASYMTEGSLLTSLSTGTSRDGGAMTNNDVNYALDQSMGKFSEELLAGQKGHTLGLLNERLNDTTNPVDPGLVASLKGTATSLKANTTVYAKTGSDSKAILDKITGP